MTPVDPLVVAVLVVLAALVGIVAGFIGARVQDRFRLTKSQTDAKDIVARAEKEANNLRKEAELKTKDEFFKKREEFNREMKKTARRCASRNAAWKNARIPSTRNTKSCSKKNGRWSTRNASCTSAASWWKNAARSW